MLQIKSHSICVQMSIALAHNSCIVASPNGAVPLRDCTSKALLLLFTKCNHRFEGQDQQSYMLVCLGISKISEPDIYRKRKFG